MHAPPPNATPRDDSGWWLLAGIAIALVSLALQVPVRGIDPDELEHLHAAFCVWQGQIPYRDFFEHHSPALYWCAQPAFWISGARLQTLWLLRAAMWLCSAAIASLILQVGAQIGTRTFARLATYWFLWSAVFQRKGLEFRPDVPATLLICGCLVVVIRFHLNSPSADRPLFSIGRASRQGVMAALGAGLATAFTQKAIVPLACLAVSSWLVDVCRTGRLVWPRVGLTLGAGIAAIWALLYAAFGAAGAGAELIDSTVLQLIRWPVRSQTWQHLRPTLAADILLWLFALAGCLATYRIVPAFASRFTSLFSGIESPRTISPQLPARLLVGLATVGCVLSLVVVKATFPQYYLLWFPLLALAAAMGLEVVFTSLSARSLRVAAVFLTALALGSWLLLGRGLSQQEAGPFPHATSLRSTVNCLILAGALTGAHFVVMVKGRVKASPRHCLLLAMLMSYGSARALDAWSWSNARQVAAINRLHKQIAPTDTVLDGFTGLAALRPHAWYYWWLNEFSLGLIAPDRMEQELGELFENHPPHGVLDDDNLTGLPAAIRERIARDYRPVDPPPLRLRSTRVEPLGD